MAALTTATVALAATGVPQSVGVASAMGASAVPKYWHAPRAWLVGALCIHRHEGAWNDKRNPADRGGMQFAWGTWRALGGRGDPAEAPAREQLYRAWLLWRVHGWRRDWPNTSRACGLR